MNGEAAAKTELGIVPDCRDVFHGSDLRVFGQYVDRRIELRQSIKELEAQVAELDEKLTRSLVGADCTKIQHGNIRVQIITKENKRLDREKLLANGVTAAVIVASTVVTESSYLDCREIKQG